MYKSFTADDFRKFHDLGLGYCVDGMFIVGNYKIEKEADRLQRVIEPYGGKLVRHTSRFLNAGYEVHINDKCLWFFVAYGGTMLSEFLHIGCMLGTRKNILSGLCGGLKRGVSTGDIILPTQSSSDGSSVYMYDREHKPLQPSNDMLRASLRKLLREKNLTVYEGKTVTCQAMLGETQQDVLDWSAEGYFGVEMEASTVFAVSNHFGVPSAAILSVADNLIENHTVLSENFEDTRAMREAVRDKQFEAAIEELVL